jgi:hypothetical protein
MITDMKVIKKILNEHVEVELPYPFKEGVEIKYTITKFRKIMVCSNRNM